MMKNRLEAFSDGVMAIIITIMVLELKIPHGDDFATLQPLVPIFFSYILSFMYIGMYWNNHHHLIHMVQKVNGRILWANLHLLFWLSLLPSVTGWMGENHFAKSPTILYGIVLLMSSVGFWILTQIIISAEGKNSKLSMVIGKGYKEKISLLINAVAIPIAFFNSSISQALYLMVASMWLLPDRRIELTARQSE